MLVRGDGGAGLGGGAGHAHRTRRAKRRLSRAAPLLLAAALLASCFDPPVEQSVHLELLDDGRVEVSLSVSIDEPRANAALRRRVRDLREALLGGFDEWSPRFEAMSPVREITLWDKRDGELTGFERTAIIEDPEDLRRFFADADLGVFYTPGESGGELGIYPGSSTRATRRQRREVEEFFAEWIDGLGGYLDAAAELYDYLDASPGRARAVFGSLFEESLAEGQGDELPELEAGEEEGLERLVDAMDPVLAALVIAGGDAYSLDELSSLVYDPFPARITVRPPAAELEVAGFRRLGDGMLEIEPIGLWPALAGLEGRWLTPDPLLLMVELERHGGEVDLDELVAAPRRADRLAPASEIQDAIRQRLAPAAEYKVSW